MLKDLSYLDSNRTGIWGWSYGGYLTLMTLMQVLDKEKSDKHLFKVSNMVAIDFITIQHSHDSFQRTRMMSLSVVFLLLPQRTGYSMTQCILKDLCDYQQMKIIGLDMNKLAF